MAQQVERSDTNPRPTPGTALGWLAMIIALFDWLLATTAPSTRHVTIDWLEPRVYDAAIFGSVAAVAIGMGLRSMRIERPRWVGVVAATIAGVLVVQSIAQLARWL